MRPDVTVKCSPNSGKATLSCVTSCLSEVKDSPWPMTTTRD